jgi:hypothetical protein
MPLLASKSDVDKLSFDSVSRANVTLNIEYTRSSYWSTQSTEHREFNSTMDYR